jgi:hypothetical protein
MANTLGRRTPTTSSPREHCHSGSYQASSSGLSECSERSRVAGRGIASGALDDLAGGSTSAGGLPCTRGAETNSSKAELVMRIAEATLMWRSFPLAQYS